MVIVEIDERTKAGKAILDFFNLFVKNKKGVTILSEPKEETKQAMLDSKKKKVRK